MQHNNTEIILTFELIKFEIDNYFSEFGKAERVAKV
jgi:hypothetical protein